MEPSNSLKGKEIALSHNCYPDILIGNIPHIYYYWVGKHLGINRCQTSEFTP
jgi:hypothetical protein